MYDTHIPGLPDPEDPESLAKAPSGIVLGVMTATLANISRRVEAMQLQITKWHESVDIRLDNLSERVGHLETVALSGDEVKFVKAEYQDDTARVERKKRRTSIIEEKVLTATLGTGGGVVVAWAINHFFHWFG